MPTAFRIPKLTDREVVLRLNRVRSEMKNEHQFVLRVHLRHGQPSDLPEEQPDQSQSVKFALDANSQVIQTFELIGQHGRAFVVERQSEKPTDLATVTDDWASSNDKSIRPRLPQLYVQLLSLTRELLQAADVDAALTGHEDSEWNRYREAQMAVTNSLQQAAEALLVKAGEQNVELDRKRTERFEKLEETLRAQLEAERAALRDEYEAKQKQYAAKEKALDEREASFETKESHYVARQKQSEQIDQVKDWLEGWSLTEGTRKKRAPIAAAYLAALLITGGLTFYATWHGYALLQSVDEIVKLAWWQWVGIWVKAILPLAAFATFMIYYIRWSGDWARQHSDEEFRNRTRLIDIGRSAWLLEAVRDAQERKSEIPADLLHELSRNLFAANAGPDVDIHPQAISDLMMQGLSNLRIRSADGSEVEASRGKKS